MPAINAHGTFREGLRSKNFSAREVTEQFLGAIKEKNGEINAYLSVRNEAALAEAKKTEDAMRQKAAYFQKKFGLGPSRAKAFLRFIY